jgi:hypothetical protein
MLRMVPRRQLRRMAKAGKIVFQVFQLRRHTTNRHLSSTISRVKLRTERRSDLSQEVGLGEVKKSRRTLKPSDKAVWTVAASEEEGGDSEVVEDRMADNNEVLLDEAGMVEVCGARVAMVKSSRSGRGGKFIAGVTTPKEEELYN